MMLQDARAEGLKIAFFCVVSDQTECCRVVGLMSELSVRRRGGGLSQFGQEVCIEEPEAQLGSPVGQCTRGHPG